MTRPRPPPFARRPSLVRSAVAVSELVGNLLLLSVTVVAASGFTLLILTLPPPSTTATAIVSPYVLPTATDRLVIEHRGGPSVPLRELQVTLDVGGVVTSAIVGDRLAAGDPKWSVVSAGGTAKTANDRYVLGDQVRYTDAAIRGQAVTLSVSNREANVAYLNPVQIQSADSTSPILTTARTVTATLVEVTFNERLRVIDANDFRVAGVAPTAARLLGNGSKAELTVSSLASSTPTVTSIASPAGTRDLAENLLQGSLSAVASDALATSRIVANVIYPSFQDRNDLVHIGLNVVNPTSSARQIQSVQFSVAPTLGGGGGDKFFRGTLTNGAGSDLSCTWSGGGTDTVTCTPASPVTLPALGVRQVVMRFTTSDQNADAQTVLTGTVTLTTPSATITSNSINVRHENTNNDVLFVRLLPEASQAGNELGSPPAVGGGAPKDFYFEWEQITAVEGPLHTTFTIPAGWTALSVPTGAGQGAIQAMSISIAQPTPTQPGKVVVSQESGDRDFFFRVTPPAGAAVYTLPVEMIGHRTSNPFEAISNQFAFGVQVT